MKPRSSSWRATAPPPSPRFWACSPGPARCAWSTPFSPPPAIARDLVGLEPAVVVAAAEDFSPEVRDALRARGAAAIALTEMDAAPVDGLEQVPRDGTGRRSCATGSPDPHQRNDRAAQALRTDARHGRAPHRGREQELSGRGCGLLAAAAGVSVLPAREHLGHLQRAAQLLRGHRMVLVDRFSVERVAPPISGATGPSARVCRLRASRWCSTRICRPRSSPVCAASRAARPRSIPTSSARSRRDIAFRSCSRTERPSSAAR